jgi:hypothetical protein
MLWPKQLSLSAFVGKIVHNYPDCKKSKSKMQSVEVSEGASSSSVGN